MSEKRMRPWRF